MPYSLPPKLLLTLIPLRWPINSLIPLLLIMMDFNCRVKNSKESMVNMSWMSNNELTLRRKKTQKILTIITLNVLENKSLKAKVKQIASVAILFGK